MTSRYAPLPTATCTGVSRRVSRLPASGVATLLRAAGHRARDSPRGFLGSAVAATGERLPAAPFLLFLNLMLLLNWVLFALIGMHRAATGQTFTYPLTLGRT